MGSYVREPVSFMIREKGFPLSTIRVVRKGWLNEVKIDEFLYDFEWILKDRNIYMWDLSCVRSCGNEIVVDCVDRRTFEKHFLNHFHCYKGILLMNEVNEGRHFRLPTISLRRGHS